MFFIGQMKIEMVYDSNTEIISLKGEKDKIICVEFIENLGYVLEKTDQNFIFEIEEDPEGDFFLIVDRIYGRGFVWYSKEFSEKYSDVVSNPKMISKFVFDVKNDSKFINDNSGYLFEDFELFLIDNFTKTDVRVSVKISGLNKKVYLNEHE